MKRVVFRVDSGSNMGSGHVMRCLALAEQFRKEVQDIDISFVSKKHPGNIIPTIRNRGFIVYELELSQKLEEPTDCTESQFESSPEHIGWIGSSVESDATQTVACFGDRVPDWVIVDHYGLDYRWEKIAGGSSKMIMAIDDLCNRKHYCDVILDQTYGRDVIEYKNLVQRNTKLLLGCGYALLNASFRAQRLLSEANQIAFKDRFDVLVTFGGADPKDYTSSCLEVLIAHSWPRPIYFTVVLGSLYSAVERISASFGDYANVRILHAVDNMPELMRSADACVSAAGSTAWELCCIGTPSILIATASNQSDIAESLGKHKIALSAGTVKEVPGLLRRLITDKSSSKEMSKKAKSICDGLGAQEVTKILRSL